MFKTNLEKKTWTYFTSKTKTLSYSNWKRDAELFFFISSIYTDPHSVAKNEDPKTKTLTSPTLPSIKVYEAFRVVARIWDITGRDFMSERG